jgi:hypothetical protein
VGVVGVNVDCWNTNVPAPGLRSSYQRSAEFEFFALLPPTFTAWVATSDSCVPKFR